MPRKTKAVLFDLDGTLIDTAPDFVAALNSVLVNAGHNAVSYDIGKQRISDGSVAMLRHALEHNSANIVSNSRPDSETDDHINSLRGELLRTYEAAIHVQSQLFSGMENVLKTLEANDIQWGIVTNKPGHLTDKLLQSMALYSRSACVVSGDTLARAKPHPDPILHACSIIDTVPEQCIMVGDSYRDVDAGRAAGTRTLVARYGYIPADENSDHWQADGWIDSPSDILSWL